MREIKFRAWVTDGESYSEMYPNVQNHIGSDFGFGHMLQNTVKGLDCKVMQYTGLKDKNGVEICEGDLLNIYFTSSDGEYTHDCIYKTAIGALGGVQFQFVNLLWVDGGRNQYPTSTTLCERYEALDYEYENDKVKLKVPDSWGENHFNGMRWKQNDKSFYFEVIGNIYENPELLESL